MKIWPSWLLRYGKYGIFFLSFFWCSSSASLGLYLCSAYNIILLDDQVVSVQATNLTSQDMYLTLLAPSSLAASTTSSASVPASETPSLSKGSEQQQSLTVREVLAMDEDGSKPKLARQLSSRRMSLPPVQPMEVVLGIKPTVLKERIFSDATADTGSARTHIWLQSTVPLGYFPIPALVTCIFLNICSVCSRASYMCSRCYLSKLTCLSSWLRFQ